MCGEYERRRLTLKIIYMKKLTFWIALLVTTTLVPSFQSGSALNPSGKWEISDAKTYDGKSYTGELNIVQSGSVYNLGWKTSAGNYPGVAILDGSDLMVGWGINTAHGVLVYNIETAALKGRWTSAGQTKIGTENVTLTNGKLEGTHMIAGSNPDGTKYTGTISFEKAGDLYNVSWAVGKNIYNGIGIQVGQKIVVGWGLGKNFGVVHYALSEKEAKGQWAIPGATKVSTENLKR